MARKLKDDPTVEAVVAEMSTMERIVWMGAIWDALSDAQQAAWLLDHHLEYGDAD